MKTARKEAVKARREAEKDAKRHKTAEKLQVAQKVKVNEKPKVSLLNFFSKTMIAASPSNTPARTTAASFSPGERSSPALGLSTGAGACPDALTEAATVTKIKNIRANLFSNMPFHELLAEARRLDGQSNGGGARGLRRSRSKCIKLEVHVEGAPTPGNSFADVTYVEPKQVCVRGPMKALQFHEDLRPMYWGTCSLRSHVISGRRPMAKDVSIFDYSVDSEAEWEEESEGGEELVSEEDEGGPGVDNEPDSLDYEDGWLKHDEDALIFSGDEGEGGDDSNECGNNANATDPKNTVFQISQNRSIVGVRYIEDGQLVPSALAQQRAVVLLAVEVGKPVPAEAARDGRPYAFESLNTLSNTINSSAVDCEKNAANSVAEKKTGKPKPFLPEHLPLLVKMLHGCPFKKDTIISEFVTAHPEVGKKVLAQMITSIAMKEASVHKTRVWVVKEAIFQQLVRFITNVFLTILLLQKQQQQRIRVSCFGVSFAASPNTLKFLFISCKNSSQETTKGDKEDNVPLDQLSPLKGQKSLHEFIDPTTAAVGSAAALNPRPKVLVLLVSQSLILLPHMQQPQPATELKN